LRHAVGIPYTGRRAQDQTGNERPGTSLKHIGIDDPPEPATDDQGSKQFCSYPNGLAEPRIKRIL
jgi:hypothetical protein